MQFDTGKEIAQKCDLCVNRLDQGLQPACVIACPSHCMYIGDINDVTKKLGESRLRNWHLYEMVFGK